MKAAKISKMLFVPILFSWYTRTLERNVGQTWQTSPRATLAKTHVDPLRKESPEERKFKFQVVQHTVPKKTFVPFFLLPHSILDCDGSKVSLFASISLVLFVFSWDRARSPFLRLRTNLGTRSLSRFIIPIEHGKLRASKIPPYVFFSLNSGKWSRYKIQFVSTAKHHVALVTDPKPESILKWSLFWWKWVVSNFSRGSSRVRCPRSRNGKVEKRKEIYFPLITKINSLPYAGFFVFGRFPISNIFNPWLIAI